jgi:hypothetical protein
MIIDEELPRTVRETIGETKSRLIVLFNPKEFIIVDLLPQDTSFIAVYFVNNAILLLANRHAQQRGISAVTSCVIISRIPSVTLLGMSKNTWPSVRLCSPLPVFTRLGHRRHLPVWPVKTRTLWEDLGQ